MKEFKSKSDSELKALINEKKTALQKFRFGIAGGKVKNVKEGKNLRKDVARVMTEISARKNAVAVVATKASVTAK